MNKKSFILSLVIFVLGTAVLQAHDISARRSVPQDDEVVTSQQAVDDVGAVLQVPNIASPTSTVVADLSDNLNFRHVPTTGSINVSSILTSVHSTGTATVTVKYGVVASTSAAGAVSDISWFHTVTYTTQKDGAFKTDLMEFAPSLWKTRVANASTTQFVTNDRSVNDTGYAPSSFLTSPRGSFTVRPEVGDLVMRIYDITGRATVTSEALYHTQQ